MCHRVILGRGARAVIGVGRVKTPTLAIVCRRELEIRQFVAIPYFEIVATAQATAGRFQMRHAPKERIIRREEAEAHEIGDFEPGKAADFLYLRPRQMSPLATIVDQAEDPERILSALFALAGQETVREVRVQGAVVYKSGNEPCID